MDQRIKTRCVFTKASENQANYLYLNNLIGHTEEAGATTYFLPEFWKCH